MENTQESLTCDFCDQALKSPWFVLKTCRNEGCSVRADYQMRMCNSCYPKIHYPLRKAAFELMRQCFQDSVATLKQELQAAGLDTGQ